MFFFLTLFIQTVLGYSAIRSGIAYLPLAVGVVLGAAMGGALVWLWPNLASFYGSLRGPATMEATGTQEAPASVTRPKISDRFEPGAGGVP